MAKKQETTPAYVDVLCFAQSEIINEYNSRPRGAWSPAEVRGMEFAWSVAKDANNRQHALEQLEEYHTMALQTADRKPEQRLTMHFFAAGISRVKNVIETVCT